jgi:hypothetical protein
MVSDLAKGIEEILPFANTIVNDMVIGGNPTLLEESVNKLLKLVDEAACFICEYVKQRPIGTRKIRLPHPHYSSSFLITTSNIAKLWFIFD